jgi:transcriptional regulator GlxA family with amidase domain
MREITTVLFNDFETLDVFGPIEIFGRLKEQFIPQFYSQNGGIITSSHNVQIITKAMSENKLENYILFIPGGVGTRDLVKKGEFINQLKLLSQKAEYIFTVCTGSVLFSKTGLMNNRKATSNKRSFFWAKNESPEVNWIKKARWIKDENIYSSSGVSAGMDMALGFISDLLGYEVAKKLSLEIEYEWHEDADWDPFCELYE